MGAVSKSICRQVLATVADFHRHVESEQGGFCPNTLFDREVTMNATVSILAEIPEDLHESLKRYLETHPTWDQDRVFAAALSLFLLQNGNGKTPEASQTYRACARVYLESLFQSPA